MKVGGTEYLKRGWNRKDGRKNKDFKKGRGRGWEGKLGQGVGALKKRELELALLRVN